VADTLTTKIDTPIYQQLKRLILKTLEESKCLALWALPGETKFHLLISEEFTILDKEFQLEKLDEGFLIAPFNTDKEQTVHLKANLHWVSDEPFPEDVLKDNSSAEKRIEPYGPGQPINTSPVHYLDLVRKSLKGIEDGVFEKVVPARAKTIHLPEDFDGLDFFMDLRDQYPDACVTWYCIPGIGSWFGASPEILIEMKDNIFKTVALAGTQTHETTHSIKETTWTQKEIEEQALVSRYIINCFKKIRLREFEEFGPKTVRAGNLLHLKTEFQVDMEATNFPDLGTVILRLLHPTSAICGMPLAEARNFLEDNEDLERGYFAGYLGPVNVNNSTNLYVNLRCLRLIKGNAIAYAGAGVTGDSDPVRELNETEIKMNTLMRLLK
jgi:isochorismate synthase